MAHIHDNVRQEIAKLVPSSDVNEISCFVFYDDHPRDDKKVDITICTKFGELKEYFRRELVFSLHLEIPRPTEITIARNDNVDLFYLVFGGDQLLIISRINCLLLFKRIKNVNRYEIEDKMCSGRVCLKVYLKDDAVPLVFDQNFDSVDEIYHDNFTDDSSPLLTDLMRKLTEAKYSVKCNQKMYEKLLKFRQLALFSKYQNINVNADEAVIKSDFKDIASALKISTFAPWVKICNKKIVIVIDITNQDNQSLDDIQVLLHGTTRPAITYTTKLYEKTNKSPFYKEKNSHSIKPKNKVSVAVVIDLNELKSNVLSRIVFDTVIMFKKLEKEFLLPLEKISISSVGILNEDYDLLGNETIGDPDSILPILATTEKTDLHLRHIKCGDENNLIIQDIFCKYLNMEPIPNIKNMIIHRKSPYHTLHGVVVLIQDDETTSDYNITVFTRTPCQVLALIHYIHDAIPTKIIITTPNLKMTAVTDEFTHYNENITTVDSNPNYIKYAASMLRRTSTLLEYLDAMIVKMNASTDPIMNNRIGKEIHLFMDGIASYMDFRNKILKEADKGVDDLMKCDTFLEDEAMIID